MGDAIVFEKFIAQKIVPMPLEPFISLISRYGAETHRAEMESIIYAHFPADQICEEMTIHLDSTDMVISVFLDRPQVEGFNQFAFDLMNECGFWLFEGGIETIYFVHGTIEDVPPSHIEISSTSPQRIRKPEDIWPPCKNEHSYHSEA